MAFSDLPKACGEDHVKVLEHLGWTVRKRKKGSHIVLTKSGVPAILSIPDQREVRLGLLSRELQKAGISHEDYRRAFDATV